MSYGMDLDQYIYNQRGMDPDIRLLFVGYMNNSWDKFMAYIETIKIIPLFKHKHEMKSVAKYYNCAAFREQVNSWVKDLKADIKDVISGTSIKCREKGNQYSKDWEKFGYKAIEYYTFAIMRAKNSIDLANAYANRAVLLIQLQHFENAYMDLELARKHNFPQEKIIKLYFRQAACGIALKDKAKLILHLNEIEAYSGLHILNASYMTNLAKFKNDLKALEEQTIPLQELSITDDSDEVVKEKLLIEKSNNEVGRYVIAGESVKKGECIIREKPFAFVPTYAIEFGIHDCQNCAKSNNIPYPCEKCHFVCYCSPKCATEHYELHKFECKGYKLQLWFAVGIAQLAFRMVITGFPELLKKIENLKNFTSETLFDHILMIAKNDESFKYGRVLLLVTNYDKMNVDCYHRYVLTGVMLTFYLKCHTKFFEHLPDYCSKIMPKRSEWELFLSALFVRHIGQTICNGHTIATNEFDNPIVRNVRLNRYNVKKGCLHNSFSNTKTFTAIYPKISMMNHACDASIKNLFEQDCLKIMATEDIAAGQQIYNCYGARFDDLATSGRNEILTQQYFFKCKCSKCQLPDKEHVFFCQNPLCKAIIKETTMCTVRNQSITLILTCKKCKRKFDFEWFNYLSDCLKSLRIHMTYPEIITIHHVSKIIYYYNESSKFVPDDHFIKRGMPGLFLPYTISQLSPASTDLNKQLFVIAVNNLKYIKQKYEHLSIQYIRAASYFLDLYILCKDSDLNVVSQYASHIKTIKEATQILPDSLRIVYNNYIKNYID